MPKLLHLTDLHAAEQPTTQIDGLRSATRTSNLFAAIQADSRTPPGTIIVISGDLVDECTPSNNTFAAAAIGKLRASGYPILVCPGNHDYYHPDNRKVSLQFAPGFWAQHMEPMSTIPAVTWLSPQSPMDYPVVLSVGDTVSFLILDSNADSDGNKLSGGLGSSQIGKLAARIALVPAAHSLVVVVHHDPWSGFVKGMPKHDRDALKAAIGQRGAVLLLCGHTHSPEVRTGADLDGWRLALASNGGLSAGHERGELVRRDSPHLLYDLANPTTPTDLRLPW